MSTKKKLLVALAFVVGAFYTLETVLTIRGQGFTLPVLTKGFIAGAALFYGVFSIAKGRSPGPIGAASKPDA
jgi:hypothetical protein